MSRASRVPRDINLSPEMRKFHDEVERRSQYVDVNGNADFTTLKEDGSRVFAQGENATGGVTFTEYDHGTITSGTITPNPATCLKQKVTNNGTFTIAATGQIGDVELRVINAASAGSISFSGFDKQWSGDALTTTDTHQFVIFIYGFDGKQAYLIKALQ
jgi:hypothetical protein